MYYSGGKMNLTADRILVWGGTREILRRARICIQRLTVRPSYSDLCNYMGVDLEDFFTLY